jgi:hypothetical protein
MDKKTIKATVIILVLAILFGPALIYFFNQLWYGVNCGWDKLNVNNVFECAYTKNIINAKSYELIINQSYSSICIVSGKGINCDYSNTTELIAYSRTQVPESNSYTQIILSNNLNYGSFKYLVNYDDGSSYILNKGYYCTGDFWSYWTCLEHL